MDDQVITIQKTKSRKLRNDFLRDMEDEAINAARSYLRREPTGEESSIALYAMNEAIDRFDKKASFRTFLSKVITSRLTDFFRKEKIVRDRILPHPNIALIWEKKFGNEYKAKQHSEDLSDELVEFLGILGKVGYTWWEVEENRPTHVDSRNRLKRIALHIVSLRFGERFIQENPLSRGLSRELKKLMGIDRKTLKRYRPYLCALIIVLLYDDFPVIRNYLGFSRKEIYQHENP